jgi:N-methylhydantoinase B
MALRSTKHTVAPKGLEGGMPGRTGKCTLDPGTEKSREIPSRYSDHLLRPGDIVRLETPGGGGLGNPRERDPERVLSDVRNGYVSIEKAREVYGVAIRAANGDFAIDKSERR